MKLLVRMENGYASRAKGTRGKVGVFLACMYVRGGSDAVYSTALYNDSHLSSWKKFVLVKI